MTNKQIRLDVDLIAEARKLFPRVRGGEREFIEWVMQSLIEGTLIRSDSVNTSQAAPSSTPIATPEQDEDNWQDEDP
jgi:hypothetical protein